MKILGISCFYHDAAAALVFDGRLVAAAGEERFTRIKHDPELPANAVKFCLKRGGIDIDEINYLAFYDKPFTKFDRIVTGYMATPFRSFGAFCQAMPVWLGRKLWTERVIRRELGYRGRILYLPHHLSHAAGAYYCSPFDKAAILTVDGVGEWATASYGIGDGNRIRMLARMNYPHSVGLLYSAFTYYLGFRVNSAEYKVMGLAPYGKPRFAELIKANLVRIHDDGSIHLNLDYFSFHHGLAMTGKRFAELFGRPRRHPDSELEPFHQDVAASLQSVTEEIILRMAGHVRRETEMEQLCLSGGVALNCAANGRLLSERLFESVYIQPASGDAGGAIGATLYSYYKISGDNKQPQPFFDLGPKYEDDQLLSFLNQHGISYTSFPDDKLTATLAERLADGAIVAVYQGAMEFGPRALGFRSILADPRDPGMKEKINRAIKYRESFRPFAPAVPLEKVGEWFECDQASPYMLVNHRVAADKRSIIPAVTHIDHSARLQTVAEEDNPLLYDLLVAFGRQTGVPVLLNTSFNLRGHPIVNRHEEAFATFCSGAIDILLMGGYVIEKDQVSDRLIQRFTLDAQPD